MAFERVQSVMSRLKGKSEDYPIRVVHNVSTNKNKRKRDRKAERVTIHISEDLMKSLRWKIGFTVDLLIDKQNHLAMVKLVDPADNIGATLCTAKGSLAEYGGHAIRSYFTLTPDTSWLPLIFPGDVRDFNVDDDNFTIERDGRAFSLLFDLYTPPATSFESASKPTPNIGTETKVDRSIAPTNSDMFGQ